jgi:hypothetical protein
MRSLVVFGSDHCRDCGTREIARVVHGAAVSERYALLQSATVALEPIASTTTRGGKGSRRTERWYPVEYEKVLPFSSPDGNYHACWSNALGKPDFRCIMLPGMASLPLRRVLS